MPKGDAPRHGRGNAAHFFARFFSNTFDEKYFLNLDEETKKKLIDDKIVDKEISFHLNFEKYEIIKKYPDNDLVNDQDNVAHNVLDADLHRDTTGVPSLEQN